MSCFLMVMAIEWDKYQVIILGEWAHFNSSGPMCLRCQEDAMHIPTAFSVQVESPSVF